MERARTLEVRDRVTLGPQSDVMLHKLLPILGAKPGDVFAHATDKGNYLNPDMWYDVVIFKGVWDPDTSDPTLLGDTVSHLPKGWLVFHWHPNNPGCKRSFYQAGAWQNGKPLVAKIDGREISQFGGNPLGIALPLEDCWGMRTLEEFGCDNEEIETYKQRKEEANASYDHKKRIDYLKELTMTKTMEDSGIIVRKKQKAAAETAEPANPVS